MTYTQDNDYTTPPSNIINYLRDKVPFLGSYTIMEISDNTFVAVIENVFGRQEVFTFSRSGNYNNTYSLTDRFVASEHVACVVSNPLYIYSNVDGIMMEDYRTGSLSDVGIIVALAFALVISFLGRFTKRDKN